MARYPLNLPSQLKKEAAEWAAKQKVSLNQFILWAVSEKVGALKQNLDDLNFPMITYRRGAAGIPTPVLHGTAIRVQTIVGAVRYWGLSLEEVASEYDLSLAQVQQATDFYATHRREIDAAMTAEEALEPSHD